MPTAPVISPEQRQHALAKAAAARTARAKMREELKAGVIDIKTVFARADEEPDGYAARTKVVDVLRSLPGFGDVRANALMEKLQISPTRRVKGLGQQQRAGLLHNLAA